MSIRGGPLCKRQREQEPDGAIVVVIGNEDGERGWGQWMAQGQGHAQAQAQAQGSILEAWQTGISISIPCSFLLLTGQRRLVARTRD
jgi:hypothetical protein